jgi:type II secretory pathway component PulF
MSENVSRGSRVAMAVLLVLHAICGVAILWLLLKLVPQYEKIFKDFNAKLPDMTVMVINLSALFARFWYVLVPGLGVGDIAIMLALHRTGHNRLMTAWGVLVWLAAMLLMGLIVQEVFVPINDLIMNLSGGK